MKAQTGTTTSTTMSPLFEDLEERHRRYPHTFVMPRQEELGALRAGDYVKVIHRSERLWIRITRRERDRFLGTIANGLIGEHGFDYGDEVAFERRHIYVCAPEHVML